MQILPQFIFNSRDPIVMGVMVENGIIKEGTPICVPSREVNKRKLFLIFYGLFTCPKYKFNDFNVSIDTAKKE